MTGVDYDPFSPGVLADPFPAWAELRARCPVHRFRGHGFEFVTLSRYADVQAALKDHATWSSRYGQGPQYSVAGGMLDDPPGHTMFRRMVLHAFTPRVVERMAEPVAELAEELLDAMEAAAGPAGRGDLHDGFACPLPVITIARMLGVAEDDRDRFKAWSDAQVAALGTGDRAAQQRARAEMEAYFADAMQHRRRLLDAGEPLPDDLVSGLVTAARAAPREITDAELYGVLVQLLVGGNETTTSLITNCVWRLLADRPLWEAVCADPEGLAEVAIEESLRFDPPVLGLFRTAARDLELHGVPVAERDKAMLLYASANRDPAVFDDPDTFRLDRDRDELRRRHLAFGAGIHFCLGAPLARLEGRIALVALARRWPDLRLVGEPERIEPFLLWGRRRMEVAWR